MFASRRFHLLALSAMLLTSSATFAQAPPLSMLGLEERFREQAIIELSSRIDTLLATQWQKQQVQPAPIADDAEFLRRVYLDLVGRIPRVSEVRAFLDDPRPDKRILLISSLMDRPSFLTHMSATMRADWLPQAETNPQLQFQAIQVETWLRNRLRDKVGYDEIVRRLLTTPFNGQMQGRVAFDQNDPMPFAFYQLMENKAENLAASTTRLFLGIKLECAQCHNHPHAPYTRDQFWEFAAFFSEVQAGVRPTPANMPVSFTERQRMIRIPNTERTVTAKFLDGKDPQWKDNISPRQMLAEWITSPENPYFARNVANRMWFHFFGTGLIDPIDEPSDENLPTNPELLNAMSKALVEQKFDLRFLMSAITRSQAYQRTSRLTHPSQENARQFARMAVRGLSAEQLWESMVVATGYRDPLPANQRRFAFNGNQPRGEFMSQFNSIERRTERQTSILQALMLMNGRFITDQTSIERSEILAAIVEMPFGTPEDRIESLFMTTVSRKPTPLEMQKLRSYVIRRGAEEDAKQAYADIFWALLNSSEFMLNH